MSNLFEQVLTNASGVEEEIMGPDYDYSKKVLSPDQLGISSDGTTDALTKDLDGVLAYTDALLTGRPTITTVSATTTGQPLGNKFFLQTGQKCKDVATGEEVTRSIYINNVPDGSVPFISSAMGVKLTDLEGIVPGTLSDLSALNPFAMMQSFLSGSTPDCQSVTLETIDANDNKSQSTAYVTLVDLQNMEGYKNMDAWKEETVYEKRGMLFQDGKLMQIIFIFLTIIGFYVYIKDFKMK
jgi:hypothetical protein